MIDVWLCFPFLALALAQTSIATALAWGFFWNNDATKTGTGLLPINQLSIRVRYEDGRYQRIKTRFQMSQFVRFLDRLEPMGKS